MLSSWPCRLEKSVPKSQFADWNTGKGYIFDILYQNLYQNLPIFAKKIRNFDPKFFREIQLMKYT